MPWKPDYLTVAAAKAYLRVPDAVDDAELQVLVTAASRAIDEYCGRQFGQLAAPAARVYPRAPAYNPVLGLWCLEIDDVQDVTGATVNGVAFASSGAVLLPHNAPAEARPWTRIGWGTQPSAAYPGVPANATLSMRWGWAAQPSQVDLAARLQVARWAFRRDAPSGVAGSPESGSEMRLLARLDPDVKTSLVGLRRRPWVA